MQTQSLVPGEGREGGAHPVDHRLGRVSVRGSDRDGLLALMISKNTSTLKTIYNITYYMNSIKLSSTC